MKAEPIGSSSGGVFDDVEYFSPTREESLASALDISSPLSPATSFSHMTIDVLHRVRAVDRKPLLHIPRACRYAVSRTLATIFRDFASAPHASNFIRLLVFPKLVLHGITVKKRGRVGPDDIRRRLALFEAPDVRSLNLLLTELETARPRKPQTPVTVSTQRAEDLAREGEYSRAVSALTSSPMRKPNEESLEDLVKLHPARQCEIDDLGPDTLPRPFMEEDVRRAVQSFSSNSAPGTFGLRPELLRECHTADISGRFLSALTDVVNVLHRGDIPNDLRAVFAGASLTGISKKGGGTRPIAAGETLRRLVAKCIASRSIPVAMKTLEPLQVGVGSSLGTERVARLAQLWHMQNHHRSDKVLVKFDIRNAFNSVSRAQVLARVRVSLPELLPWLKATYVPESLLKYGPYSISSCDGVQQGDPLGPLLFALAIHPLVTRIHHEVPGLDLHRWYLDDGVIAGSTADVAKAVAIVTEVCPPDRRGVLGLSLNASKCEVAVMQPSCDHSSIPGDFARVGNSFELLGAPVGNDDFILRFLHEKSLPRVKSVISAVQSISDPQVAYSLLRDCCTYPRFVHLIRTLAPRHTRGAASVMDFGTKSALENICGTQIRNDMWQPATWGTSRGGLGLRSPYEHAAAAFVASTIDCAVMDDWDPRELPDWIESVNLLSISLPQDKRIPYDIGPTELGQLIQTWSFELELGEEGRTSTYKGRGGDSHLQRTLSALIEQHQREKFLEKTDCEQLRAHLMSTGSSSAGAWLRAIPSKGLFLAMPAAEFRTIIRWRLNLHKTPDLCRHCKEHHELDNGRHTLTCKKSGDATRRHNALRGVILEAASRAGCSAALEQSIGDGRLRPADVLIHGAPPTCIDVAITHPCQPKFVRRTSLGIHAPDTYARDVKLAKYSNLAKEVGALFVPFVADVYGNLCEDALKMIKRLGRAAAIRRNERPSRSIWFLRVRVSFTIASAIAKSLVVDDCWSKNAPITTPGGQLLGPATYFNYADLSGGYVDGDGDLGHPPGG